MWSEMEIEILVIFLYQIDCLSMEKPLISNILEFLNLIFVALNNYSISASTITKCNVFFKSIGLMKLSYMRFLRSISGSTAIHRFLLA